MLNRNSTPFLPPQVNEKPRVLLLSASSGAGHVRAAQASKKLSALAAIAPSNTSTSSSTSAASFQRVYDKAYISMVRGRTPELMGVL